MKRHDTNNEFFKNYLEQKPQEMWIDLKSNNNLIINLKESISIPGQFYETIICGITGNQINNRVYLSLYDNFLLMSHEHESLPMYALDVRFAYLVGDFNLNEKLEPSLNHSIQISKLDKFVEISTNDKDENLLLYDKIKKFCIQNNIQKDYKFIGLIGRGRFGKVFSSVRKRDHKKFAIKKYKIKEIENNKKDIINELNVLTMINEPTENKLLKIAAIYEGYENVYMVTELLKGGTLLEYIKYKDGLITEAEVFELVLSITKALKSLDKLGIVHMDLKPDNIMLNNFDDLSEIVVIDFGCSTILNDDKPLSCEKLIKVVATRDIKILNIFTEGNVGTQRDIYSFGTTIYFFLTGNSLFKAEKESDLSQKNIECGICFKAEQEKYKDKFSPDLWDFLAEFLHKDPKKRITLHEIEDYIIKKATDKEFTYKIGYRSTTDSLVSPTKFSNRRLQKLTKSTFHSRSYHHATALTQRLDSYKAAFKISPP